MKNYLLIWGLFIPFLNYAQKSLFTELNEKGLGNFSANNQLFYMHRSIPDDERIERGASSVALTINYKSPIIKNISLDLSYIQSIRFNEYSSTSEAAAELLQNESFGILNNLNFNYHLNALGLKNGLIKIGRFPLHTEFFTTYQIRQKEQAYEGVLIDLPKLGNWGFKIGYLSRFSSWKSNPHEFRAISENFKGGETVDRGQEFVETKYHNTKTNTNLGIYYSLANDLLHTSGFSFLQKGIDLGQEKSMSFRIKSIVQWKNDSSLDESIYAVQPGILFQYKELNIEGGLFLVDGSRTNNINKIQNPFGARIISSEPLVETDKSLITGNKSFYLENSYRFEKGKIYLLYLYTDNHSENTMIQEFNMITSYHLSERWTSSLKTGFLIDNSFNTLDVRFVLNYSF